MPAIQCSTKIPVGTVSERPRQTIPKCLQLGSIVSPDLCCNSTLSFLVDFMGRGFLFILLLIALPVAAQIYKYTDATGNTAYSNQPPDGVKAQPVELPPLNSVERQTPAAAPAEATRREQPRSAYEVLELTNLPTTEALRANNGSFTVNVLIKPRLQGPHLFRLLLDDQPYGQPSNVPTLQLVNIDRGLHSLAVQVIDGENIVQQSPTVTFTVQRVHKP